MEIKSAPLAPKIRGEKLRTPLEMYLIEINNTLLLTAEKERELANRIEEGDEEARDHMARANLRLVVHIASGYRNKGLLIEDIIAEGNVGLLEAIKRFDPKKNVRLSTYASWWIKQQIRQAFINKAKTIRIPSHIVTLKGKIERSRGRLESLLKREPTNAELARRLDMPANNINAVKYALSTPSVLQVPDSTEGDISFEEATPDKQQKIPEDAAILCEELGTLREALSNLDEKERTVITRRYGLYDTQIETLKEVGAFIGRSKERVRQIELSAIHKLGIMMKDRERNTQKIDEY